MRNFTKSYLRSVMLAAAICALGLAGAPPVAEGDVAIVVRPDVPVDNLSFAELRRLMLGDRQFWTSNLKVTLLVRAPGAREREDHLSNVGSAVPAVLDRQSFPRGSGQLTQDRLLE